MVRPLSHVTGEVMKSIVSIAAACAVWMSLGSAPASAVPEAELADRFESEILPFCLERWTYGSLRGAGGVDLEYATYKVAHPRGAVVILPGRTEPFLRYCELVYDLRDTGYDVFLIDHRGQGWSDRLLDDPDPGYVDQFGNYVADVHAFMRQVVLPGGYPRIVGLAHSMGGGILTRYAELHPRDFAALVLSAPMLAVDTKQYAMPVAYLLAAGASLFGQGAEYAPGQGRADADWTFEDNSVTHSEARFAMRQRILHLFPELLVGGATFRWVKEALEGTAATRLWAFTLDLPILMYQVDDERYVANWGQDEVCARAAHCEKHFLPGTRHEIFLERDEIRAPVLKAIRDLLAR